MIDVEDLIALVRNYNPRSNADLIRRAYAYGMQMHEGQFRKSGEPYFTHPVAVAAILTEQQLDDATIVTALLHDTIEDTKST
jgi:GTP pyrophosphokinase/guanosine-3',5'-bis(diphosphate) 3'-pyrophosphohydrolase